MRLWGTVFMGSEDRSPFGLQGRTGWALPHFVRWLWVHLGRVTHDEMIVSGGELLISDNGKMAVVAALIFGSAHPAVISRGAVVNE